MSFLSKYFRGGKFRTTHPTLQSGSEVNVFLAEYDSGEEMGVAFIGDTRLYLKNARPEHVEKRVRVAVGEFDAEESVGRGEFIEVVGGRSYVG